MNQITVGNSRRIVIGDNCFLKTTYENWRNVWNFERNDFSEVKFILQLPLNDLRGDICRVLYTKYCTSPKVDFCCRTRWYFFDENSRATSRSAAIKFLLALSLPLLIGKKACRYGSSYKWLGNR